MADDSLLASSDTLIAGRFAVDTSQVLLDAGGGIPTYLARDRMAGHGKRVAVAVSRDASPRINALKTLIDPIENLMVPLGHGVAPLAGGKGEGYFIICVPPPGPPVSAPLNIWPEKILIDLVLRPIARVLEALQSRGLTHRSILSEQCLPVGPRTAGNAWRGLGGATRHAPARRVRVPIQRNVPSGRPLRRDDRRRCLRIGCSVAGAVSRPGSHGEHG